MYVTNGKNSIVRLLAGFLVWGSVMLSQYLSPNWLFLAGFVGIMLMFSSVTGICPMGTLLKKMGVKEMIVCEKDNSVKIAKEGN